jgi:hypothetical protein
VPLHQETLPPPEVNPMPPPDGPAPVLEPQEGRVPNSHIRKVSKKRFRAAPTDSR